MKSEIQAISPKRTYPYLGKYENFNTGDIVVVLFCSEGTGTIVYYDGPNQEWETNRIGYYCSEWNENQFPKCNASIILSND